MDVAVGEAQVPRLPLSLLLSYYHYWNSRQTTVFQFPAQRHNGAADCRDCTVLPFNFCIILKMMPEPPQLAPLGEKEQRFYSELL